MPPATVFAHSTENADKSDWHLLSDHLASVSEKAGGRAQVFEAGDLARIAGWFHDFGKQSEAFQRRLSGSPDRADHSTAGAFVVYQMLRESGQPAIGHLLAYLIAGHHAGLPDSGVLKERLDGYAQKAAPLSALAVPESLPEAVRADMAAEPGFLLCDPVGDFDDFEGIDAFQKAFLGRMVFSALVDADYADTEAFYAALPAGTAVDRSWPTLGENLPALIAKLDASLQELRASAPDTEVVRLRQDILQSVRQKAVASAPGAFTMTVPTGGGKTLASLAFALDHAQKNNLRRIVYAIPFTAIIDQTADIYRNILGDDMVLEHHSAVDVGSGSGADALGKGDDRQTLQDGHDQRQRLRRACEDWAAPVIVTTTVQLFESLFSHRPTTCRKLHQLAGSVLVLDEVQTLPVGLLLPCLLALDELVRNYNVSVVLCTATQPVVASPFLDGWLEALKHPIELAPQPEALAKALQRVTIERPTAPLTDAALIDALADSEQGLVIVNSRRHALALFDLGTSQQISGLRHLTTRQHAHDRRRILADLRQDLKAGRPCRVIATSLVECGVDFDFPRVWRAETGLDQMAQAAGRCNREGTRPRHESRVTLFTPAEESLPSAMKHKGEAFLRMADAFPVDDLFLPAAVTEYFQKVYLRERKQIDKENILEAFSCSGGDLLFNYATVSERFCMIDSGMTPVIVAVGSEGRVEALIRSLEREERLPKAIARDLQPWIVQVPPRFCAEMLSNGAARFVNEAAYGSQFVLLTRDSLYTPERGLLWSESASLAVEECLF